MTFRHGRHTACFIDKINASPYFSSMEWSRALETADTTTFGVPDKTFVLGLGSASFSADGFFDGAVDQIDPRLWTIAEDKVEIPVTFCPDGGATTGRVARLMSLLETQLSTSSPITSATKMKMTGEAVGGGPIGHVLNGATTNTTDAVITGASTDNGAATTTGAVVHIHASLNSRSTSISVKVQHSTDNTAWVDLTGGTQVVPAGVTVTATAPFGLPTAYRLTVSGTINRYVRALITPTAGTGSYIAVVALART